MIWKIIMQKKRLRLESKNPPAEHVLIQAIKELEQNNKLLEEENLRLRQTIIHLQSQN